MDKQQASDEKHRRFQDKDSDFLSLLNLWDYLKTQQNRIRVTLSSEKHCRQEFLNFYAS